jgi:tRNA(Glu) U13 pseudouridine synthase TruD
MTYIITKSEAMHLHSTLEDAMMFYEMYTSKPSDIADNEMEFRLKDCEQAQDIVKNLESQDGERPTVNYYGQEVSIGDTDYFD